MDTCRLNIYLCLFAKTILYNEMYFVYFIWWNVPGSDQILWEIDVSQ